MEETTKISINGWLDKQTHTHTHMQYKYYSNLRDSDMCYNTDVPWGHHANQSKRTHAIYTYTQSTQSGQIRDKVNEWVQGVGHMVLLNGSHSSVF